MLARLIGEDIEIAELAAADLPSVLADRAQLEQVLINLAINARDAMPTNGTLTIETRSAELDDDYAREHAGTKLGTHACISMTDTGTGIAPEQLEHIFEPIYTTKEAEHGTGLGLGSVYGIVNSRTATCSSTPRWASDHVQDLPPAVGGAATRPARPRRSEPLALTETILVCEDEHLVRRLIETILTTAGYRVMTSRDPHDALELAADTSNAIDLLVTDVIMPKLSGPELAIRLRASRPGLRALFLSGYTAATVRERGNLAPDSAFLEMPFDRASLLRQVRALRDQRDASPSPPAGSGGAGASI